MPWIPRDMSQYCVSDTVSTGCQPSTLMFFALISKLVGKSKDVNIKCKPEPKEFDFIVVGAGSAGSVVVNRLTENDKWNVLLLEGGEEEPEAAEIPGFYCLLDGSNIIKKYELPQEKTACRSKKCSTYTGKVMGGCSTVNHMVYIRGNPEDFNHWAEMGNIGWNYEEVLEYFKKSENNLDEDIVDANPEYHGTGGYMSIQRLPPLDSNLDVMINAYQELGFEKNTDFNAGKQLGVGEYQFNTKYGARQSTNAAFIRPIRNKRPNLVIKTKVFVTRVIINPDTKRAVGVEYFDINKAIHRVYVKKEVILSAGTFGSPKILLLSGIGPREQLKKHNINLIFDSPVGQNYQNHVSAPKIIYSLPNSTLASFDEMKKDFDLYRESQKGPLSTIGFRFGAFIQTKKSDYGTLSPDIHIGVVGVTMKDVISGSNVPVPIPCPYYDGIGLQVEVFSLKSRGFLRLNATDPIWGDPEIYTGHYSVESDFDPLLAGVKIAMQLGNTKTFRRNGYKMVQNPIEACKKFEFSSNDYWKCAAMETPNPVHHMVGTCKMGPKDDPEAVVDPRLRVHGVYGLRIIDAAIMPVCVHGNTHAAAVMIGEKGSDMIKEDWYQCDS